MAEKFLLILSVILQTLMAALLLVQIIRADITAVIIHTLLITFATGILITAIEEYRQSKHQNP